MSHKLQNNYNKEILALLKKVLGPTAEFPSWGSGKGTENPREFDFGGKWDLLTELPQDWGKTLGRHKQNLVCTRTQKKGAATPQETDPDLPVSVQESPVKVWVSGGQLQGRGH